MRCGGYNLPFNNFLIAEGHEPNLWMDGANDPNSPHAVTLEEEIYLLRSKMEKLFLQENSFTSDIVIEISSLLDLKINEFMRVSQKNK
ncbi:aspartyl-phosphate phosphatase Spo0E family protein [Paenibacillus sanguinis]|uniref:aspartyl-phosphate phosphatase Spo0E family protein n=1 Tax=Paenibacillus sanguinis TaxID=225906 RepID=UPI00035D86ED|nr:aspartyl-phosphate phosphatase Spo0E family protein [Paenibacillus sanguinis]